MMAMLFACRVVEERTQFSAVVGHLVHGGAGDELVL